MAETVGALILTAAGVTDVAGIAGLGTLAGTTVFGASLATIVGTTAIIGVSIGLQYALSNPQVPKPEDGSQAVKQSIPARVRGYGTNRLAGAYMLYESAGPAPAGSYDVQAFHSGRVSGIRYVLLNDDTVVLSADINSGTTCIVSAAFSDDRYNGGWIKVEARLGTASQSALASFVSDPLISGFWTPAHQGNGIAYVGMVCGAPDNPSDFSRIYPRGKPELSVIVDCSVCWDARDPAQHRLDEATWQFTKNPVIQLINFLTLSDGGMGLDYAIAIEPNLAAWMVEADLCDDLVATADGGLEPRYRSDGWFYFDNAPENIISSLLATCDGWFSESSGNGAATIVVGVYRAPSDPPLTEKHLTGFALNYGFADEELVNQLDITFTDPANKYVSNQTEPWRDEDSISAAGIVRNKALELTWVQSPSQARRLADRAMQRLNSLMTGTFTTGLYGLRYLGKRWVPLQYPFVSGLQNCVVEIQDADVDLINGEIVWKFLRIQPDLIEAYDPDTNEGDPPVTPPVDAAFVLLREDGSFYLREADGLPLLREDA